MKKKMICSLFAVHLLHGYLANLYPVLTKTRRESGNNDLSVTHGFEEKKNPLTQAGFAALQTNIYSLLSSLEWVSNVSLRIYCDH